jgi:hypothetical protein
MSQAMDGTRSDFVFSELPGRSRGFISVVSDFICVPKRIHMGNIDAVEKYI